MEKLGKFDGLSLEELEAQRVELLPVREEMQSLDVAFGDITVAEQTQTVVQVGGFGEGTTEVEQTVTAVQIGGVQAVFV
jgi:hypothetical protein